MLPKPTSALQSSNCFPAKEEQGADFVLCGRGTALIQVKYESERRYEGTSVNTPTHISFPVPAKIANRMTSP